MNIFFASIFASKIFSFLLYLSLTYFAFCAILFAVMKEKIYERTLDRFTGKVLTCDQCSAEDSEENEVREWGNPYDWGTICEECDCHET